MIDTYKNVSTAYYLLGLIPVDAAVLLIIVFFPLFGGWWFLSLVILVGGYKFAKKYRERHYSYLDLLVYLTTPERYSVATELRNGNKTETAA